jgi:hypothetical protein
LLFSFSQAGGRNGLKIASQLWKSQGVYGEIESWFDALDEPTAQVIARYFNGQRWHHPPRLGNNHSSPSLIAGICRAQNASDGRDGIRFLKIWELL